MKMPEVLNGQSLSVRVRLQPIELGISLKAEDLSTATIKLDKTAPEVGLGEWIRITAPNGEMFVGYVKTKNTDYISGETTLNIEHVFGLLDEMVMFGEFDAAAMGGTGNKVPASTAMQFVLSKQTSQIFSYGSCAFPDSQGWKFTNSTIKSALTDIFEALADAQWEFNQTVFPFTVSIKQQPTTATMEMRKNRNLSSMKVNLDRSQMYTRVYPIGNKNLHIDGDYIDRNTSQWGIVAQTITDSTITDKDLLRSWANAQLKRNADPAINVSINGIELSESTGESMDHFRVGKLCRVPLPDYGITVTQRMVELSWRNALADPLNVTVSLASEHKTLQGVMNEQARGGSGGKKAKHQHECDLEEESGKIYEFENSDIWINRDNVWAVSAQYDVFTDGEGRHVRLKSGALLEVERESGIYQTVGDIISDQDQDIEGLESWVDTFEGSALWTQRDNITGVCGEYEVEYYTDSSGHRKKRLKIKNGTGLVMERNGASFGVYDTGNLTAGVMIQRMNDGSTNLRLKANRIDIQGVVESFGELAIFADSLSGNQGHFGYTTTDDLYLNDKGSILDGIKTATTTGGVLKLYDWRGNVVANFSKAVASASWTWSNGAAKVVLSPQDQTFYSPIIDTWVKSGSPSYDNTTKLVSQNFIITDENGQSVTTMNFNINANDAYTAGRNSVTTIVPTAINVYSSQQGTLLSTRLSASILTSGKYITFKVGSTTYSIAIT